MRIRTKALLVVLAVPACAIALQLFGPTLIARSFKWWLQRQARAAGCEVRIAKCEKSSWFEPIEMHEVLVVPAPGASAQFEFRISTARCRLNPFHGSRHGLIRSLEIDGMSGAMSHAGGNALWRQLDSLLPDEFNVSAQSLQLEANGGTVIVRDLNLAAGEEGSGAARVGLFAINSPLLHQELRNSNVFVRWKEHQFTIGTVKLGGGLTIESLEVDLSRVGEGRIAATLGADVFHGRLRATFATEAAGNSRLWDVAASTSEIPLASIAAALGLREPVDGEVHASKFTFRGDPHRLLEATCSVWLELTGLRWRNRTAEVLMVGAALYSRELELQQLYIKQRGNELTLSGEAPLRTDWLRADFRGDVTASINDIGQFAQLFGMPASQFAGRLSVHGSVRAGDRKVSGELVAAGNQLTLFGAALDSLTSRLLIDQTNVTIDQLEIRRANEMTTARASIDLRTADIEYLTLATLAGSAAFTGHAESLAPGISVDLIPSQPLFVSTDAATMNCFSTFGYSESPSPLEVKKVTVESDYGVRLVTTTAQSLTSLSPETQIIELPFCSSENTDLRKLVFTAGTQPALSGIHP